MVVGVGQGRSAQEKGLVAGMGEGYGEEGYEEQERGIHGWRGKGYRVVKQERSMGEGGQEIESGGGGGKRSVGH